MTDQATTQPQTREDASESSSPDSSRPLSTADIAGSGLPDRAPESDRSSDADRPRAEDQPATDRPSTSDRAAAANATKADTDAPLFDDQTAAGLRSRWQSLQVEFVDEPRGAVEKADGLVAEVMKDLAETFARERRDLESAWSGGREASTEDLRQAIRRYRSFFNRLLSI